MAVCLTPEEMRKLAKGDAVDAIDKMSLWGKAHVCDVTKEGVMIHFDGFKKTYDELMTWNENFRLCARGTMVGSKVNKSLTVKKSSKSRTNGVENNKPSSSKPSKLATDSKVSKDISGKNNNSSNSAGSPVSSDKGRGWDGVPGTKIRITKGAYEGSVGTITNGQATHGWWRVDVGKDEVVSVRVGMFDVISTPKPPKPATVMNGTANNGKRGASANISTERASKRSKGNESSQVLYVICDMISPNP